MANKAHLNILKKGADYWNRWRKMKTLLKPDLSGVNLSNASLDGANLHGANLSDADFSGASLRNANLGSAHLVCANLQNADLSNAGLLSAYFCGANLSDATLRGANLIYADLGSAFLHNADLRDTHLSSARLTCAKMHGADLRNADLSATELLDADLQEVKLTGACIRDWHINSGTKLDNVSCEFVFLEDERQERYPSDRNFVPGEFAKLFQELENVVELIFHNGLNWRAFAFAFNQVNTRIIDTDENGEIFLREYKFLGDGLVALKVVTPPKADKTKIRDGLNSAYEKMLRLEGELNGKDAILTSIIDKLFSMTGDTYNNHVHGNLGSLANKLEDNARQQTKQYNIGQNQTLIEVAQEIQQIYDQLLQTEFSRTADELDLAKQLRAEIEKRPTLKQRFVGALKNGGAEALKELVDRSGFNILLEFARGWMNPD